jgi:hypothetical protein
MKKIILVAAIFFAVMFANTVFATGNTVNSGWVNVPVTDTQPFEVNCEYRVWNKEYNYTFYSILTAPTGLSLRSTSADGMSIPFVVDYLNKRIFTQVGGDDGSSKAYTNNVDKLEKRCKLPDTAPSGMIGQFALAQCPDGWSTWLFAKATVECNTSNCKIAVCKKD